MQVVSEEYRGATKTLGRRDRTLSQPALVLMQVRPLGGFRASTMYTCTYQWGACGGQKDVTPVSTLRHQSRSRAYSMPYGRHTYRLAGESRTRGKFTYHLMCMLRDMYPASKGMRLAVLFTAWQRGTSIRGAEF